MFGARIPSFHLRGKSNMKTNMGATASISILLITLLFALIKFEHLVSKRNPSILTNKEAT